VKKLSKENIDYKIKKLFKGDVSIKWDSPYISRKQKVLVNHKVYGIWKTSIDKLLQGRNHPNKTKYESRESIDKDIKKVHKNTVNIAWSKTKFPIKLSEKVYATDSLFGSWTPRLSSLLKGERHRKIFIEEKRLSKEIINKKVKAIYNNTVSILWTAPYINNKQFITALDKDYGSWRVRIYKLLQGSLHPKRSAKTTSLSKILNKEIINKRIDKIHKTQVKIIWGDSQAKGINNYVLAEDISYGTWKVKIHNLLQGQKHPERARNSVRLTPTEIDTKIKKIFKGSVFIDWARSGVYKNNAQHVWAVNSSNLKREKAIVSSLMKGHNPFNVGFHFSKAENEIIDFIKKLGFDVVPRANFKGKSKFEIDIFIPSLKIGIEYNGIYYHSSKFKNKDFHFNKRESCKNHGIRLITLWENDWTQRPEVIKRYLIKTLKKKNPLKNFYFENISYKQFYVFHVHNSLLWIDRNIKNTSYLSIKNDQKEEIGVCSFQEKDNNVIITSIDSTVILDPKELQLSIKDLFNKKNIILKINQDIQDSTIVEQAKLKDFGVICFFTNFKKINNIKKSKKHIFISNSGYALIELI